LPDTKLRRAVRGVDLAIINVFLSFRYNILSTQFAIWGYKYFTKY
jgi:hypothetical protein